MEAFIGFLPALACGALMFFCMRHMAMGSKQNTDQAAEQGSSEEIAELRQEIARLRTEQALTPDPVGEETLTR